MENKKLLKFLLRDLHELDEMVTEKGNQSFDELEMEFVHTRVKGAKKLIQILYDRDGKSEPLVKKEGVKVIEEKVELPRAEGKVKIESVVEESSKELEAEEEIVEAKTEGTVSVVKDIEIEEPKQVIEETEEEIPEVIEQEIIKAEMPKEEQKLKTVVEDKELDLKEEETIEANSRLGDSFSKEKSVNDLIGTANDKLEHKISNRPVANIQAAIGINDRFQFIRELFDGNTELFSTAVSDLDKMGNISEAVEYIQKNYKWNKNETSLKFVNLVKRRFVNE